MLESPFRENALLVQCVLVGGFYFCCVVVHGTKGLTGFKKPSVAAGKLGDHFFLF